MREGTEFKSRYVRIFIYFIISYSRYTRREQTLQRHFRYTLPHLRRSIPSTKPFFKFSDEVKHLLMQYRYKGRSTHTLKFCGTDSKYATAIYNREVLWRKQFISGIRCRATHYTNFNNVRVYLSALSLFIGSLCAFPTTRQ